jgi:hypothetical protein
MIANFQSIHGANMVVAHATLSHAAAPVPVPMFR